MPSRKTSEHSRVDRDLPIPGRDARRGLSHDGHIPSGVRRYLVRSTARSIGTGVVGLLTYRRFQPRSEGGSGWARLQRGHGAFVQQPGGGVRPRRHDPRHSRRSATDHVIPNLLPPGGARPDRRHTHGPGGGGTDGVDAGPGVRRPLGLAYDRGRGEFLVTGANGHHTVLLRIDRRGDRVALVAGGIASGTLLTDVSTERRSHRSGLSADGVRGRLRRAAEP